MAKQRSIVKARADVERMETGAVQFGDDWPGVFLRGDYAMSLAAMIRLIESGDANAAKVAMTRLVDFAAMIEREVVVEK